MPGPNRKRNDLFCDHLHVVFLEAVPLAGLGIVLRVHEALPVGIIDGEEVATIVVAGVAGLFAEEYVLGMGLNGPDAMVVLPGPEELVEVLGASAAGVFLQHGQVLQAFFEHGLGGHVPGADAAKVLVGDLLETLLEHVRLDVVRVDVLGGRVGLVLLVDLVGLVDLGGEFVSRLVDGRREALVLGQEPDALFADNTAFGVGTGGELVTGGAADVAHHEQAGNGAHPVVAPLVVVGAAEVVRTADPETGAAGMGTEEIRLGRHNFGRLLVGLDVLTGPDACLADTHVEEVFPGLGLEVLDLLVVHGLGKLCHGLVGMHEDGAFTGLHVHHHHMVTHAGTKLLGVRAVELLGLFEIGGAIVFACGIGGLGLEEQEPGANRAVTVLEAGGDEAVFHQGQLGADLDAGSVAGTGVPDRIPCTALTFTNAPGTEHVNRAAAAGSQHLGLEDEDFVLTDAEADGSGDPVLDGVVEEVLHNKHTLVDVVHPEGVLGSFGNDDLVGLTVDHDLPLTRVTGGAAVFQLREALGTVVGVALVVLLPDRKAPLLEHLHAVVNVAAEVVGKVLTGDAHKVGADVLDVVSGIVLTHVGVDGAQTHGNGAGAVHGSLVNEGDLVLVASGLVPANSLKRAATGAHATAHDQHVGFDFDDLGLGTV